MVALVRPAQGRGRPHRRSLGDRLMTRVVNPVVRRVLASPAHDVLGESTTVITMTGRRTGRTVRVPVNGIEEPGGLAVLSRRDRRWWRNLRGGAPVRVLRAGHLYAGQATVDRFVTRDEVAALLARAYEQAGHPITAERASALARDRVVIRVALAAQEDTPAPPLRGRPLWRRWTATVAIGETAAFALPALSGALLAAVDAPWWVVAPVVLVAGMIEGSILGFAQVLVVRRALPGVRSRAWIRATVAGALVAWTIGLVPTLARDPVGELPAAAQIALFVVLGAALVSAMGVFQWRLLRREVADASFWVPGTALAWLAGLTVFMSIASPLWHADQAVAAVVAIGILAGAAMAVTVAAVSGVVLVHLVPDADLGPAGAPRERRPRTGRRSTRAARPSARGSARVPERRAPR
jgi:hypothetical protein